MKIGLIRIHPVAKAPSMTFDTDAGLDLFALQRTILKAQQVTFVPVGYKVQMPLHEDLFAWNATPSAVSRKQLIILPGIIDVGYDGDCGPLMFNLNDVDYIVEPGEKVSQLIVLHRAHVEFTDQPITTQVLRSAKTWGVVDQHPK